jgi:four helix bundle protein
MEKIKSFKDLKIWQQGIDLTRKVYLVTSKFPKEEVYGLTSQMRRSAVSIPSNVAEGFKRSYGKEYKQFLQIVLGSAAELETQSIIAHKLGFIPDDSFADISQNLDSINKMTSSLIKKIVNSP